MRKDDYMLPIIPAVYSIEGVSIYAIATQTNETVSPVVSFFALFLFIVVFLAVTIFYFKFNSCPHCKAYIKRNRVSLAFGPLKYCSNCGENLRPELEDEVMPIEYNENEIKK